MHTPSRYLLSSGGEKGKPKGEDTHLSKIVRDSSKISREHLHGTMTQVTRLGAARGPEARGAARDPPPPLAGAQHR